MRVPRGCDVAHKATWQSHAGPRERLRGEEVTRRLYLYLHIYFHYSTYSLPLISRDLLTLLTTAPYKPVDLL